MLTVSESKNLSADIRDAGAQKVMLHACYSARTLNLTVEVLDSAYVKANGEAVRADTAAFIAAACTQAAEEMGLPVGGLTAEGSCD